MVSTVFSLMLAVSLGESIYEKDVRFALDALKRECARLLESKNIDWGEVSREFSGKAKTVKSDEQHLDLLIRLVARLRDGHAEVRPLEKGKDVRWSGDAGKDKGVTGPGLFLCRIGDAIVVKNCWATAKSAGIEPGMKVVAIDGTPARKWLDARIAKRAETVGFSTTQHAFFDACHQGLQDAVGTRRRFELDDLDGKRRERTITYSKASFIPDGPAFPPADLRGAKDVHWAKTKAGFGYVHVRRCPEDLPEQIDEALADLENVPGLVLDFRGNSGGGVDHDALMGRFVAKGQSLSGGKRYPSAGPHPYGGPIVVIVDATVRSTGETASGIFKEDGRAPMIGESATAGMSSQKTTIELPSRLFALYVSVASNKERFNDGRGIEGVGVSPNEIVECDRKDLAAGIDTQIRRAEDLLRRK